MAWAILYGIRPTLFELEVIDRLDSLWYRLALEKIEADRPKDGKTVRQQVRPSDSKGVMKLLRNLAARAGKRKKG